MVCAFHIIEFSVFDWKSNVSIIIIGSFFMPAFFMIAGYSLKFSAKKLGKWSDVWLHIMKRFFQCMVPFLCWPIINALFFGNF